MSDYHVFWVYTKTMENTLPAITLYAITYGRIDIHACEGLHTLVVTSKDEAKDMAKSFIQVIPDDLDSYERDIDKWNGVDKLVLTHSDDDSFYFSITRLSASGHDEFQNFTQFVQEFMR